MVGKRYDAAVVCFALGYEVVALWSWAKTLGDVVLRVRPRSDTSFGRAVVQRSIISSARHLHVIEEDGKSDGKLFTLSMRRGVRSANSKTRLCD